MPDHLPSSVTKTLLLLLILSVALPAQRRNRDANRDVGRNPLGRSPEVVEAGKKLYDRSCTVCHGRNGDEGDRAPALAGQRRYLRYTDPDLFTAIKDGIKGTTMPSMGLSEEDTWRVVAYIRSLRATAIDAPPPEGDPKNGETIFWGKGGCSNCHMLRGRGGVIGPNLSNIGAELRLQAMRDVFSVPKPYASNGYKPLSVVLNDGTKIRGVIKNENNFSIQLLSTDGKLHLLLRSEIAQADYETKPLMPADYPRRLGPDFADLIAFLSRQGESRR